MGSVVAYHAWPNQCMSNCRDGDPKAVSGTIELRDCTMGMMEDVYGANMQDLENWLSLTVGLSILRLQLLARICI